MASAPGAGGLKLVVSALTPMAVILLIAVAIVVVVMIAAVDAVVVKLVVGL